MSNLQASTESLETAAQCWCDKETSHIEMSAPLATAFAKRLDEKDKLINAGLEREEGMLVAIGNLQNQLAIELTHK